MPASVVDQPTRRQCFDRNDVTVIKMRVERTDIDDLGIYAEPGPAEPSFLRDLHRPRILTTGEERLWPRAGTRILAFLTTPRSLDLPRTVPAPKALGLPMRPGPGPQLMQFHRKPLQVPSNAASGTSAFFVDFFDANQMANVKYHPTNSRCVI